AGRRASARSLASKWCIDTEYPKRGTLYKRCDNAKRPAVSISAKIIVAQTGAKCAFNNGMIAGTALSAANAASRQPLYLIEVACPAVGNLIYWMWRDNDLLNVKPFHREALPSGGQTMNAVRSPHWVRSVLAYMAFGVLLTIAVIVLSVSARSDAAKDMLMVVLEDAARETSLHHQ